MQSIRRTCVHARSVVLGGILTAVIGMLAGCATEGTSDLPWNTPQSWEGTVTVPGFSQDR